ncbi:DUF1492 domain-containing protein [Acetobacterium wieringae]|uniref:DUF1492 domain-containing protein n=1 Tax=Acetobacterium wieringae TaxID=52694 RepID=UPI002B1F3CFB|nr:DUF1492 domain-containing protein [Acetobacterium wieringae]MEA4805101.1 DUF1492 domain-containing protein [Acetobacterium wieringae]
MSNKAVCRPKDNIKDEVLRSYLYHVEEQKSLERELEILMAKATKMTSQISDMPRGGGSPDMGDLIIKWLPLQKEIEREIDICTRERRRIRGYLDTVKDQKYRTILQLTYIEGMKQKDIAKQLDYCVRQVQRYQDEALKMVKINLSHNVV